jgi:predicted DNA-binding transcriptional regulator YafY
MFSGEMRSVELCCDNELIENIIDRFGDKTPIVKNDDKTFILRTRVALSEGLVNWIMQFGEKIKIISPPELKEKYIEKIEKIYKLYNN